nr:MAG TPA: hypothetical protein [Caudoviricetes sp.]
MASRRLVILYKRPFYLLSSPESCWPQGVFIKNCYTSLYRRDYIFSLSI